MQSILNNGKELMKDAISSFNSRLATLRTGRANAAILYGVNVNYYGSLTPIEQVGQISVVEGRQLVVKLFDPSALKDAEKAINDANLGLLAQNDGNVIRINVPQLTEETRREVSKSVGKYAEEAKVVIRNIRRDLNDEVKKGSDFTEDQEKKLLDDIQKLTNEMIAEIDTVSKEKVKEIMTV